jgi:hypothetical protein
MSTSPGWSAAGHFRIGRASQTRKSLIPIPPNSRRFDRETAANRAVVPGVGCSVAMAVLTRRGAWQVGRPPSSSDTEAARMALVVMTALAEGSRVGMTRGRSMCRLERGYYGRLGWTAGN